MAGRWRGCAARATILRLRANGPAPELGELNYPNPDRVMSLSRRDFASLVAGAFAGLALSRGARASTRDGFDAVGIRTGGPGTGGPDAAWRAHRGGGALRQESYFQWVEVRPNVHVAMGGGGNTMLYRGRGGALQSDGKNFGLGRALRVEAEGFDVAVTHFVNTHHHGDHSGGNEGFPNALRLAHENAAPRIRATAEANLERAGESLGRLAESLRQSEAPAHVQHELQAMIEGLDALSADDFMPTRLFSDEHELSVDGLPVECRWVSRGHTDGDNFLFLPRENVLHCGDLFFHGRHPYVDDTAGATPAGWIRCVEAMLRLCDEDTVVVPGHGEIADRAALVGQADYFRELQTMVAAALEEGRTREEVTALAPEHLVALAGSERHLPRNLGIVYDEMNR